MILKLALLFRRVNYCSWQDGIAPEASSVNWRIPPWDYLALIII